MKLSAVYLHTSAVYIFEEACVARSGHTWSFFVSTLAIQSEK